MSGILALDQSKARTGFMLYFEGDVRLLFDGPHWPKLAEWGIIRTGDHWAVYEDELGTTSMLYGHWVLGKPDTNDGDVFNKLQRCLAELHAIMPFDRIFYETAIPPHQLKGQTTYHTVELLFGLTAAIKGFAAAYYLKLPTRVDIDEWRAPFVGQFAKAEAKAKAALTKKMRGTSDLGDRLKILTMERARYLGFKPRNNDEGDVIGIMTFALGRRNIDVPWLTEEGMRALTIGAAI